MLGSIPEATSGVTASHLYAVMLEDERKAAAHNVSLIGHCTDSASNSLNALIKLATPSGYLVAHKISFLGLKLKGYHLFAPFFAIIIHQLHMLVGIIQDRQCFAI